MTLIDLAHWLKFDQVEPSNLKLLLIGLALLGMIFHKWTGSHSTQFFDGAARKTVWSFFAVAYSLFLMFPVWIATTSVAAPEKIPRIKGYVFPSPKFIRPYNANRATPKEQGKKMLVGFSAVTLPSQSFGQYNIVRVVKTPRGMSRTRTVIKTR